MCVCVRVVCASACDVHLWARFCLGIVFCLTISLNKILLHVFAQSLPSVLAWPYFSTQKLFPSA